jgi:hypothetical protein
MILVFKTFHDHNDDDFITRLEGSFSSFEKAISVFKLDDNETVYEYTNSKYQLSEFKEILIRDFSIIYKNNKRLKRFFKKGEPIDSDFCEMYRLVNIDKLLPMDSISPVSVLNIV